MTRALGNILFCLLASHAIVDAAGMYYEEISGTDGNTRIEGSVQRTQIIHKSFHQCTIAVYCKYLIQNLTTGYFSMYNSAAGLLRNMTGLRIWRKVQLEVNECQSSPCKSGGACHALINGYRCQCVKGTSGESCDKISRSCKQLKAIYPGIPSGFYPIDGSSAGVEKLVVFCDMDTDGGGWTQVLNVTSKTNDFNTFLKDPLEYVDNLNGFKANMKYCMKSSALKVLRNITGYTQFRFKCKKFSGLKLLHIKTKEDSNGYNVAKSLTKSSANLKFLIPSCNTYTRLQDDGSKLGQSCSDWAWNNYSGSDKTLMFQPMYIANIAHWNIGFADRRYECDDVADRVIGQGDVWGVYVK